MACLQCSHRQAPRIVFVNVTNRCNMSCPICLDHVPSMEFVFEPPVDYFRRIFDHLAAFRPLPSIDLFGGEPTLREDLFRIIELAQSYGFVTRVVTNGLKLADSDYCRRLVSTGVGILFSYDGSIPELYRRLRGDEECLELKRRGLDNLARCDGARVGMVTLVVQHYSHQQVRDVLELCHRQRGQIRWLLLAPLAHTWPPGRGGPELERITREEVEAAVETALGAREHEFIPAGFFGQLPNLFGSLAVPGDEFTGAHPDCETMCTAASDGSGYVPLSRFLVSPFPQVARSMLAAEQRLARSVPVPASWAKLELASVLARHVRGRRLPKGRGLWKALHALALITELARGRRPGDAIRRHTRIQSTLQIRVMPLQDDATLQTARLARCPVVSAYVDPSTRQVACMSSCAWKYHGAALQRRLAVVYPPIETARPSSAKTAPNGSPA
jgi:uncharacterized radical SAM superfamily Fe-S cluster-containing enzyme